MAGLRRAGRRPFRVEFQRALIVTSPKGHEVLSPWHTVTFAWVDILSGTGAERRETAVTAAGNSATFVANWTPRLAEITEADRIFYGDRAYDIYSIAPTGRNQTLEFTATVRKA